MTPQDRRRRKNRLIIGKKLVKENGKYVRKYFLCREEDSKTRTTHNHRTPVARVVCRMCGGRGWDGHPDPGALTLECTNCKGSGKVESYDPADAGKQVMWRDGRAHDVYVDPYCG